MNRLRWFTVILGLAACIAGCNKPPEPADMPKPEPKAEEKPAADATTPKVEPAKTAVVDSPAKPAADPNAVLPENPPVVATPTPTEPPADKPADEPKKLMPAEKLASLRKMLVQRPRSLDQAIQMNKDAVAAAEEIIADTESTDEQKNDARSALIMKLSQGASMGIDGYGDKLRALVDEVSKTDPKGQLAADGTISLFRIERLGRESKVDGSTLDAALEIIQKFPDHQDRALTLLLQTGNVAESKDNVELATRAYKSVLEKFPGNSLAGVAQVALFKVEHLSDKSTIDATTVDAAVDLLQKLPEQKDNMFQLLMMVGMQAEIQDKLDVASRAYQSIIEKFPDEKAAARAQGMLRTLELVGKEFPFEGTLVSGEPLDPASLKGKVVVVDFWATWCGPCVGEIPNMVRLYEEFKDQGLEIVGISLDKDKEKLTAFVEERKIPWVQTFPAEGEPTFWQNPIATKYGINSIPRVFLIDKEGKLVSTRLRGKTLEDKVRSMMTAAAPAADAPAAEPPKS